MARPGRTQRDTQSRASVIGRSAPKPFVYRVMVECEAVGAARAPATVSLRDAYIRWSDPPLSLWFGQYKTPFSREYITSIAVLETADRSAVVDTLAPKRDLGIMAECALGTYGTATLGVFNGEGQNAVLNRDSTVLVMARVTVRPVAEVGLGGSFAHYRADSARYGADANVEFRGLTMRGELIGQRKRGRDRDDLGWLALGAYRALPWLQLVLRQEDFQRPSIGPTRRITATTAGANVEFPGGKTRLIVNLVSRTTGFPRVRKNSLIVQLQVRF